MLTSLPRAQNDLSRTGGGHFHLSHSVASSSRSVGVKRPQTAVNSCNVTKEWPEGVKLKMNLV